MAAPGALTGMKPHEMEFEIHRVGKFVVFQYCVSIVFITFRRSTPVQLIKAGESAAAKSLPYTLLSLLLGWWGIPWGFIYTPMVPYRNLNGGTDVTPSVLANLQRVAASGPIQAAG